MRVLQIGRDTGQPARAERFRTGLYQRIERSSGGATWTVSQPLRPKGKTPRTGDRVCDCPGRRAAKLGGIQFKIG